MILQETPLQDGEAAARLLSYYAIPKTHPIVANYVAAMRDEDTVTEHEKLKSERTSRERQDKAMELFIRALKKQPQILTEWNNTIWTVMVEKGIVHRDGHITFMFYNGKEIKV